MKNVVWIALIIGLSPVAASGASFDCGKASTPAEKLICSNAELSSADDWLAKIFTQALAASEDKDAFRRDQRAWLSSGRDVCRAAPCMLGAYSTRIAHLERLSKPFLVIKATPQEALSQLEIDNILGRRAAEVIGTIAVGHDVAGGHFLVDKGAGKQYILNYVGMLDEPIQRQLIILADSRAQVIVRGTLELWRDADPSFDTTQPISIFK